MKNVLLTLSLFICGIVSAQNLEIENLLGRLKQAPLSLLPVSFYINNNFSEQEKQVLYNYFENNDFNTPDAYDLSKNSDFTDFIGQDIWGFNTEFGTLPITPPFDFTLINNTPNDIFFADDYDGSGTLYGLEFFETELVTIDPVTAVATTIGPLTGLLSGHIPSGLAWNPVDETMYALSGDFNNPIFAEAQLYTVDLSSGALTTVGNPTSTPMGFWLAISNDGDAYVAGNQHLFSIDLATGETAAIGPLGMNLNFTQDASFDPSTNILYAATLRPGQDSVISEINVETGEATVLGTTNGDEYGAFSVLEDKDLSVDDTAVNQFSISPNPTSESVFIKTAFPSNIEKVEVFNMLGAKENCFLKENSLDISHLSSGVYLLSVTINGKSLSKKIVKQ